MSSSRDDEAQNTRLPFFCSYTIPDEWVLVQHLTNHDETLTKEVLILLPAPPPSVDLPASIRARLFSSPAFSQDDKLT